MQGITGAAFISQMNDENRETYSRREAWGEYNPETGEASVGLIFPDYFQSGTYTLNPLSRMVRRCVITHVEYTSPNFFGE